ncbi:MAG: site-2 protease family protein [Candidatus Micrarchaeia archaeon]
MDEMLEITIALLSLVVALTLVFWNSPVFAGFDILSIFIVLFFAIGIGFVAHEMAHKWVAIKFGSAARFVLWPMGVMVMLVLALLPLKFIFAAVGAVYIFKPYISRRENGMISAAGPATNILLCCIFLAVLLLSSLFGIGLTNIVKAICIIGININSFLAFFNLWPIAILDGNKILSWDARVWGVLMALAVFFMLFI